MNLTTSLNGGRYIAVRPSPPARRFRPRHGEVLTMDCIRGHWRPSGTVAGAGVFAVVWSTRSGDFWAAVHDFCEADQLRLIDACRRVDRQANGYEARQKWGNVS